MKSIRSKKYAPTILRLGLAFVFIWFGLSQTMDQSMWVSLIPDALIKISGLSAKALVIFNGTFEVVMGVFLAFGIRTRIVAVLLFLHMILIIGDLGLNAIAVRDIGLMFALLSLVFHGVDEHSFDFKNIENENIS